jgi:Ca2+-dependent lipid-binding protein
MFTPIMGILQMKIKNAELRKDTDTFTKMDPYVITNFNRISDAMKSYRTNTVNGGGKTPVWNEMFDIGILF